MWQLSYRAGWNIYHLMRWNDSPELASACRTNGPFYPFPKVPMKRRFWVAPAGTRTAIEELDCYLADT